MENTFLLKDDKDNVLFSVVSEDKKYCRAEISNYVSKMWNNELSVNKLEDLKVKELYVIANNQIFETIRL